MEARATIDPRSIPHRRRRITTGVARRINIAVITTRRRAITHQHRVTTRRRVITSRHHAITRLGRGPVTGLIRTRAGANMGVMAGTDAMDAMEVMAVAAAVTVDLS